VQGMSNKDKRILQRVDEVCTTIHTTRAEVLYALLRSIVAECSPGASGAYAPPAVALKSPVAESVPRMTARELIMRAVRRSGSMTVRELKMNTHYKRIAVEDWDTALQALCDAGDVRVAEERTENGRTRRVVLLKGLE
jgi:hypothetical protein